MNKHFTRAALCLAVVASLLAAGCNDNDAATQAPPSAEQTRLAAMIDALVSTNTPPEDGGLGLSDLVTEPPGWSREEDARVWQAFAEIVNAGPAIVPYLIENLDRTEFSTCISTSVPYCPLSVGRVCCMALEEMYDPIGMFYKSRDNGRGEHIMGTSFFDALPDKQAARDWWEQNSHKTVQQVQRDIYQWHVDREMQFGFEDDEQKARVLETIKRRYQESQQPRQE